MDGGERVDAIFGWIRNIVCFLCFINLFVQLLPNNSFQKYVKFFAGILLVIIVLGPLADVAGLKGKFEAAWRKENLKGDYNELEIDMHGMEELRSKKIMEVYEGELKKQIESIVKSHGLFLIDSEIIFKSEDGSYVPESISVTASYEKSGIRIEVAPFTENGGESAEVINIKNEIQEVYNIPGSNINISIQE
nr:stage III sporulation protein AF [Murimonas intestini]